jgi:hypothetical protein
VTDPQDTAPAELHFRSPGWNFYGGGAAWLLLLPAGVAALVWSAEAAALWGGARYRFGILTELRGAVLGGVATVMVLLFVAWMAYGAISTKRTWGQLRPPGGAVDREGVLYRTRRGAVRIAWSEMEKFVLRNHLRGRKPVSALRLRLLPDAAAVRDGRVRPPASRWLVVAVLPIDVDLPMQDAVRLIQKIAGPRLEVVDGQPGGPMGYEGT